MRRNPLDWVFILLLSLPLPGLNFLNQATFAVDKSAQIRGKVIDAETRASMELVHVMLYRHNDTIPVQATASDAKGEFRFDHLSDENSLFCLTSLPNNFSTMHQLHFFSRKHQCFFF